MSQSRAHSIIEVVTSTLIGFVVSLITQLVVFYCYGIETHFSTDIQITLIFTIVSLIRSYIIRRVFNRFMRGVKHEI